MQQSELDVQALKRAVLQDMDTYLSQYEEAPPGSTWGTPWTKDRIASELGRMRELLVDPYPTEYLCHDVLLADENQLPRGVRSAFVVAEDGEHRLLFDYAAEDFVLVVAMVEGGWSSWGIRGDAASSFLAR